MKLTISKDLLLSRLQILSKILPTKSSTPILTYFLFECKESRLFITASNMEGRITTSMLCDFDNDLSICVPDTILNGLKNLPEQPINIFIDDKNNMIIKYHGGKFEMMCNSSDSYPLKKPIKELDKIFLTTQEFLYGISKIVHLAGNDELRPVMSSVLMQSENNVLNYVATNGNAMGMMSTKKEEMKDRISFIISKPMATFMKGMLPTSAEEMEITVGSEWSDITFDEYSISMRNVEGRYPNWRSVVPKANNLKLIVDTSQFIGAIKRTMVFASKVSSLVKLSIEQYDMKVSAQDIDFSTAAEESIKVEFNSDKFEIGVKGYLILEILNCIESERIVMTFQDPSRAILISPEEQSNEWDMSYLLMPMSINY